VDRDRGADELSVANSAEVAIWTVGRPETYRQAFYARDLAGTAALRRALARRTFRSRTR
jgi:S-(hydroxymethyl)mycothiol dehydrogenase